MAQPRSIKAYISDGELILADPEPGHLPLIRQFNPDFSVQSSPPPADFIPNLENTRKTLIKAPRESLSKLEANTLWQMHAEGMAEILRTQPNNASKLLNVKVELAAREYLDCKLCGHLCGTNRFINLGKCGLTDEGYVANTFVHIGEEIPITPAATIQLMGCSLNCDGCQTFEIIHLSKAKMATRGALLNEKIWEQFPDPDSAETIEFVGGNPDESILPILRSFESMPQAFRSKPIVWNCHGYATETVYRLLDGIVDVYIPDLKGCDSCVEQISKVKNYWKYATQGIECMTHQNARIIVRILVLPGHYRCCHKPSLEWLARFRDRVWVSFLEFIPDHRALTDPNLNQKTPKSEMTEARSLAKALGLKDVDEHPEMFWKELRRKEHRVSLINNNF